MFVLICPNCENETRCKYARSGAVASCQMCRSQFDLNEFTLRVERERDDLFAPWKTAKPAANESATAGAPDLIQELSDASAPVVARRRATRRRRRVDPAILSLNFAALVIVGVAIWWTLRVSGIWAGPATTIAAPVEPEAVPTAPAPAQVEPEAAPDPSPRGAPLPRVTFTQ